MSQKYVPNEVWLVCSDGMKKNQLKVTSQSTIKISGGKLAATIDDRTGGNFVCSKMVIAMALIGAAIAALIVFTGGAAGVALGTAMAAGAAAGAATGLVSSMAYPICAMTTLMYDWTPVHSRVKFEQKQALIESSKLDCLFGGQIMICYSETLADAIVNNNRVDTLRDTVVIIGTCYFGGNMAQGIWKGGSALLNALKAKDYMTILAGGSVVAGNYAVGKLYDGLKNINLFGLGSLNDLINPEKSEEDQTGTSIYDALSSPEAGVVGGMGDINNTNLQIGISAGVSNTTTVATTTYIVTPSGTVIPPGVQGMSGSYSGGGVIFGTNNNSLPTQTVSITASVNNTAVANPSASTTVTSSTTASTTVAVRTNIPDELRSSVTKGMIENIVKDLGDLVSNWLQVFYSEDDIAQAFTNEEAQARAAIKVIENEV